MSGGEHKDEKKPDSLEKILGFGTKGLATTVGTTFGLGLMNLVYPAPLINLYDTINGTLFYGGMFGIKSETAAGKTLAVATTAFAGAPYLYALSHCAAYAPFAEVAGAASGALYTAAQAVGTAASYVLSFGAIGGLALLGLGVWGIYKLLSKPAGGGEHKEHH